MSNELPSKAQQSALDGAESVTIPGPTIAPFVLALGLVTLAVGMATRPAFLWVGASIFFVGLATWVAHLLPGRGHVAVPLETHPLPALGQQKSLRVSHLEKGRPGYRLRLPEKIHPISAGVRGGIAGGLVMTVPALLYGILSGHGVWYPVNLLTGMVLPGIEKMSEAQLSQFDAMLAGLAIGIHAVMSVVIGLTYGVLMPTLPPIPKPMAWGALLMPVMWTAVTFGAMQFVDPVLAREVDWPWFIVSQFVFGLAVAVAVMWWNVAEARHPGVAGLVGGMAGGLLMPIPAVLWALAAGHSIWYPINLLAGTVQRGMSKLPRADLEQFHMNWFLSAGIMHGVLSLGFGLIYGLLLRRLKPIPRPLVWGALLLPLLWTASAYGLIGIVNPLLEGRVNWPWFIVSQFVFGLVTAIVVVRSEEVHIPPAGGSEHTAG